MIVSAIVLVLLIQASFFLIPLVIAILLFSLTSAAIDRIAQLQFGFFAVPAWLANVTAFSLIVPVLIVLFGFVSSEIAVVLATLPAYMEHGQVAVAKLFALLGNDVAQAMLDAFQDINIGAWMRAAAGSAGNLLLTTVLVIIYIGFMFAERPRFGAKLARLFPQPEQARLVGDLISSIRRSVHHYILVKTGVSALTGIIVYGILRLFGLDFAEALAVLTFLLNFIPNLGPIIATAFPVVIALVQFDSLPSVTALLAAVGAVQFGLGNIVEPMLMGRTLQMSSFAIVISLMLWSAIWGVVGMFLAVPIMVMVKIVCAHIPALRPVAVLLSRDGEPLPMTGRDGFSEASEDGAEHDDKDQRKKR